jgi:hypothetical protein
MRASLQHIIRGCTYKSLAVTTLDTSDIKNFGHEVGYCGLYDTRPSGILDSRGKLKQRKTCCYMVKRTVKPMYSSLSVGHSAV